MDPVDQAWAAELGYRVQTHRAVTDRDQRPHLGAEAKRRSLLVELGVVLHILGHSRVIPP